MLIKILRDWNFNGPRCFGIGAFFFYPVLHVFCVFLVFVAFILFVVTFSLCFLCDKLLALFALLKINMLF